MSGPPALWRLPGILLRERRASGTRPRVPEPMVMEEETAVAAFEATSETVQGLVTTYEVTARSVHGWLPADGRVLDLGCGSGEFLRYLGERRPDCRLLGIDLSEPMLERARAKLDRVGLGERVTTARADATGLPADLLAADRFDVVTCLNFVHQLPDDSTVDRCLAQMAALRQRHSCALWVLDLVRQRHPGTMRDILDVFEPDMDEAMRRNALESEAAAFTVDELRERLAASGLGDARLATGRLGTSQVHWLPPVERRGPVGAWAEQPTPRLVRVAARRYRGLPPH